MENVPRGSRALSLLKRAHGQAVFGRRVRVLAESLAEKIPPDASVLDIGCGDGTIASLIKNHKPGIRFEGIEIAPRPRCRIDCKPFDGQTIPHPTASFDVCMFVDVLHHTLGIESLLREACRVSRRFVLIKDHLSESRFDFKTLQFMDWVGNRPHGVVLPYNYQSRAQWNQYFSAVGLKICEWQEHVPLYPFPFSALFERKLHFVTLLEKGKSVPNGSGDCTTDAGELFDEYAERYEEELAKAIGASGEGREYFAQGRVAWLKHCLDRANVKSHRLLDFGCGDGATTPLLLAGLHADSAVGIDVSAKSLEIARKTHATAQIHYERTGAFQPSAQIDLAYCNAVFHHISPAQRADALAVVNRALRIGGLFSFWEHSPWSPATRYVMSRCAFDRDAIMLTPPEARRLLRGGGFEILRTDFRFIFPRALRALRKIEDLVYRLPLGAQYHVLCRKVR